MTDEQLDRIDTLIISRVLGCELRLNFDGEPTWFCPTSLRAYFSPVPQAEWRPTEDIEQAFVVVKRMQSLTEAPEFTLKQCYDGPWYAAFDGKGTERYAGYANADTAELAICLAALVALGIEVPS